MTENEPTTANQTSHQQAWELKKKIKKWNNK